MLAFLQSFGSMSVFNDCVNMACNTGALSEAVSFKTLFCMLSRPDDLPSFKSFNRFSPPHVVMSRLSTFGELTSVNCGMLDVSSCVKTF